MQIPADKRIKRYELTFLIPTNLTGEEVKQIDSAVETLIKKHEGSAITQEEWGKKPLAYQIAHSGKKYTEAVYKHWILEFETKKAYTFEKEFYLLPKVIRHLFVIATETDGSASE